MVCVKIVMLLVALVMVLFIHNVMLVIQDIIWTQMELDVILAMQDVELARVLK